MNHYYQQIQGWFDFEKIYDAAINLAPTDRTSIFVEVGTWMGKSTCYMGVEIINSKKPIKLYSIDNFSGSPVEEKEYKGTSDMTIWMKENSRDMATGSFLRNIEQISSVVNPIIDDSKNAINMFENNSVDFVFLDADHSFEQTNAEIIQWIPKVRNFGVIAGHDFNFPGVQGAVTSTFGTNFHLVGTSWYHIVKKRERIENFKKGWFIGNFEPSLLNSRDFEVALQFHPKGFVGEKHYHARSIEYNLIVKGKVNICGEEMNKGDIFIFYPNQISESIFLEDTEIVVIRTPSAQNDKIIIK